MIEATLTMVVVVVVEAVVAIVVVAAVAVVVKNYFELFHHSLMFEPSMYLL